MARLASIALLVGCVACADQPDNAQQALQGSLQWFEQAEAGQRDEKLCHGLGLLKHAQHSCSEYLAEAAKIDHATRTVDAIEPLDCFKDVCGVFFQLEFSGFDKAGNESRELLLIKRDNNISRVYWYRSKSMLDEVIAANAIIENNAKDPLQAAYDEITNRYPTLYSYPPCHKVRASSSNLVAKPMSRHQLDPQQIDALAAACGANFCFSLVGQKIAALCPN